MKKENVQAHYNFVVNGSFINPGLDGWIINDRLKVTRQTGQWQGQNIGFLHAVNEGTASQTITLAGLPRPTPGQAEYKLFFLYEAIEGAQCTVRIVRSLGGQVEYELLPSLNIETIQQPDSDEPQTAPEFRAFEEMIELDSQETTVTLEFITPENERPGMLRGLRVAFVRLELLLEPLELDSVTIDGIVLPPNEKLRLCLGAQDHDAHQVTLQPVANSIWRETDVSLKIEGVDTDPQSIVTAEPRWGVDQSIDGLWKIGSAGIDEDAEFPHELSVHSQYTAAAYPREAVSGHFRLDIVALQEAAYFPVIDLNQSVELRVRVESHYTRRAMANREVTWTLLGSNQEDDIELCKGLSDSNGECTYTYTPDKAGVIEIVARVDSYYQRAESKHTFLFLALQKDPWLDAILSFDSLNPFIWGGQDAYPCRGDTHTVTLAFPGDHAFAGTDLMLLWSGDDAPEELGVEFSPKRDTWEGIEGAGVTWNMSCENRRNSEFRFRVSCSKLLEASPFQVLKLAHNKLAVGGTRESSRFPVVDGLATLLEIQIMSTVPGVGGVSDIEVDWLYDRGKKTLPTGLEGWCEYPFKPVMEGPFEVNVKAYSHYDRKEVGHRFTGTVLGEDPWNALATVTLNGRPSGQTGLVCIRGADPVELRIKPIGETLVGEKVFLNLVGEVEDLNIHVDPPMECEQVLPEAGMVWDVYSTSAISARFDLHVRHDQLPDYVVPGLLLSPSLEGEGTLTLDENTLNPKNMVYPCVGAFHRLKFVPKPRSPLTSLLVAAKWDDPTGIGLDLTLAPPAGEGRDLVSAGREWSLDASLSTKPGQLGLSLDFPQVALTYPPMLLSLGDNRVGIEGVREASFDPEVGQTVSLELQVKSYYTKVAVQSLAVSFEHGGTQEVVPTDANGWAHFDFTATEAGNAEVIATVPSPFDGDKTHTFHIKVLPLQSAAFVHH
ncbi:hypothetical protein SAMN04489798_5877 [Pseudomonas arsenicoxydans]|uniref:Uncharacterized protein n=1 Tax=Pseudomonas arsenicoxydans TaxID=702115 RepID=A0A1H0SYK7_9PSED|nr:Ig-like domain repeat protein [Pseudomonas arsenicoxydans]SDP46883.1 hypothetical protein SAMN04489798_5877 [Pseudomonas arsenicoxydans]